MYIDVALLPLTIEDHQYRSIPDTEVASSLPNRPTSSTQTPPLPSAFTDRAYLSSPSEVPPASGIEDEVVDDPVANRMTTKVLADREDDLIQRHLTLDPNGSVLSRPGPESYCGRSQERTEETTEQAEALQRIQVVRDSTERSDDERLGMKTSAPASSSTSTTAEPSTSIPVPNQEPPTDISTITRCRKGKERAQDSEGAAGGVANIATDLIVKKLQVKHNSSHASRIAASEAKQTGISQEQLGSMIKLSGPSNAVDDIAGDESTAGSFPNYQGEQTNGDSSNADRSEVRDQRRLPYVASLQQASSSALGQSQLQLPSSLAPVNNGRQGTTNARSSSLSREASPTRSEDSHLSYDDEAHDGGQDMGDTSPGQPPGNSGPTTPGPIPGDKRKRGTPSTGSSDRPATKHQRPEFELEDPYSPLPQSRLRTSQHETNSNRSQPASRPNTKPTLQDGSNLGAKAKLFGRTFPALRSPNSIPEEETVEVAVGSSTPSAATSHPSESLIEIRRFPATSVLEYQVFRIKSWLTGSGNLFSEPQDYDTGPIKTPNHEQTMDSSAFERTSSSAAPGSRTQPSTIPAAVPNQTPTTENQVDGTHQSNHIATSGRHWIESSRSGIASDHAIDILGLLRGWCAAFINLDAGLLAEAGLQVTRTRTAATQTRGSIGVEQLAQEAPNLQARGNEDYYSAFLRPLVGFCRPYPRRYSWPSVWRLFPAVRAQRSFQSPRRYVAAPILAPKRLLAHSGVQERGSIRAPLSPTNSNPSNLEYFFAFMKDSLVRFAVVLVGITSDPLWKNLWSSAATAPAPPIKLAGNQMTGLNTVASSVGTSQVNQDSALRDGDRRTKNAAVETEGSALPTEQSSNDPSSSVTDRHENLPSSSLDTAKAKTKQKDTKNKIKNRKNKEKPNPDSPNPGQVGSVTSDGLGDVEMALLETQAHSYVFGSSANNPPPSFPRVSAPMEAVHINSPSPMDVEWDDKKRDPEDREVESQQLASGSNGNNEVPSGSSSSKKGHREGSRSARKNKTQSTATLSQQEGKTKQPPKKEGSGRLSTKTTSDTVRLGGTSPVAEALPGPSRTGPSVGGPAVMPSQKTPSPIRKASTSPSATLALDSRDEVMVDVESPRQLPKRDTNHGSQIPVQENFGEAPIVPDDAGPPPFATNVDVSTTGLNEVILDSNTPPTDANISATPMEQPSSASGNPVQSGISIPPNPPAESAVVDQVIPETPARLDQLGPGGSIGLNINSSHANKEQDGEGERFRVQMLRSMT
ncbi:hypothetical protein M407DRAFT_228356 [Tulasnella calospora MUT 4182]|uniref:Uncharacterized protein n=1 Tax=Tulasnella calospora MUT 4182 TaxID=1051891 RepID=A0A0C3Q3Y7_9AGAM|nr:hypothetical protein M407DRAFT_228356 [Tulasnella calospora MUT 4182]